MPLDDELPTARLHVRDGAPADAHAVAEIYNASIAAGNATMDEGFKSARDIRQLLRSQGRRESLLVLEAEGEILGWGRLKKYSHRPGYRFAGETAVYVHRRHIGHGYGTLLKHGLVERARVDGYHHLVVRTWADNRACREYNRKFGYELVGIQKEIGYRDGHWVDVAILQLVLDNVSPSPAGPENQ